MDCAAPLEWDSFYDKKRYLLEWLNETGPRANNWEITVPVFPEISATYWSDDMTTVSELAFYPMVLTRRRAAGLAPYVGCPFIYTWNVGVDEAGRQIAGESRIKYIDHERYCNHPGAW